MTTEEIQFCEDNIINFESVKLGFTRNIPYPVLEGYESLYRKYLDSQFSLTYWCGECVFDMLKRLVRYYEEQQPQVEVEEVKTDDTISISNEKTETTEEVTPKKRTRKKK
jgi:hypothetical protein